MSLGLGKEFNSKAEFDHACKKYYEETGRKFTFSCNYIDTRNLKKVIKNRNLEIYYCLARCRHHREPKVLKKRVHDPVIGTKCEAFFHMNIYNEEKLRIFKWN
ncbi:GSCOCG00012236001-RA-CDS [Cotesia congregata]|nr:GSCOCG00012236001-RA-CDS [Cotesia congregata]